MKCAWIRCLPLCLCLLLVQSAHAIDGAKIDDAIAKGKAWLYAQQKNGTWETADKRNEEARFPNDVAGNQWGGRTAITTYALLAAGESPNDPRLASAIDFLKKADLVGTYAIGMRAQVWLYLPQNAEIRQLAQRDAKLLADGVYQSGPMRGLYDYTVTRKNTYSMSRAQYGVLGMWACAQLGVEIPAVYWQWVEEGWLKRQEPDGGWRYREGSDANGREYTVTPGMTAVGVATLFLAQDYLRANAGINCQGNISSPAIDKALKWMSDNFDKVASDEGYWRDYPIATLFAVERIGLASGYKYFNGVDWFDKGANYLLTRQRRDGSWAGGDALIDNVADTAFALLFLSRGRAPLAFNKLDYSSSADKRVQNWNQRPRDAANIARWIGRQLERELHFQVINVSAPAGDWHDAPILYISGNRALEIDDAAREKLRSFALNGGLIVANADCAARDFTLAMRKLGGDLFPNYEFRELPADHPIYTHGMYPRTRWRTKPSILGLSNGARELIILLPTDPARQWQQMTVGGNEHAFQAMANIFLYAADRTQLSRRGDSHLVVLDPSKKPSRSLKLARLQYDGNWDPEPAGWQRLQAILRNSETLALEIEPVKLGDGSLPASGVRVAHLTGTTPLKLTDAARDDLRKFIEAGGLVLIDSAGGGMEFASSVEAEFTKLLPDGRLRRMTADDALLKGSTPISPRLRAIARERAGGDARQIRLDAVEVNGKPAIVFSREDISSALVGHSIDGVVGYDGGSATEIMTRLLLNSAGK